MASGQTPRAALLVGLRYSDQVWTALVDGCAEAMFGLVVRCAITGTGTPWLLGTDTVYCHGRSLLRLGPKLLARMLDTSPHLSNLVSADNRRALRMLRAWGFNLSEEPQMIGEVPFLQFERRR